MKWLLIPDRFPAFKEINILIVYNKVLYDFTWKGRGDIIFGGKFDADISHRLSYSDSCSNEIIRFKMNYNNNKNTMLIEELLLDSDYIESFVTIKIVESGLPI